MTGKRSPQAEANIDKAKAWLRQNGAVNERTLASKFAKDFGDRWRFNVDEGYWLQWVGTHWARGQTPEFLESLGEYASGFSLLFYATSDITRTEMNKFHSQRTVAAMERICRSLPSFLARSTLFDADPFLLGTPGGTVDLRTGELWAAEPEDYITILTTVTPAPTGTPCPPRWQAFMDEVMAGDRDLQRTMQQWAGAGATGSTRDQRIMFLYGSGRNGKGVFCRTVAGLLGDHVAGAMRDLFVEQGNYKRHSTDTVRTVVKRMVLASEIPEGAAWDTALIKMLTGGDDVEIRQIAKDAFKVKPICTITIQGNVKPELKSVDEAIRDRFLLVTFPVYIPTERRVADLEMKLISEEGPAILRWVIDGAVDREISGTLHIAKIITADTDQYFAEENVIEEFIETHYDPAPSGTEVKNTVKSSESYEDWRVFCGRLGRKAGGINAFVVRMKRAGVQHQPGKGSSYFTSIINKSGMF